MPQTQFVKVEKVFGLIYVEFVYGKHYGFARLTEHISHVVVGGSKSAFCVAEKYYDVSRFYGDFGLLFDMLPHFVGGLNLYTARIDERESFAAPFRVAIKAVARNAGRVFYDGQFLSRNSVEKRRFADVGSAYYGY